MAKARIASECNVSAPNDPGTGAKVARAVSDAGVNILAFCAYGGSGTANFMIVSENSDKACASFKNAGFACQRRDVVLVETSNHAGAMADLLGRLAKAGISVNYCYATAVGGQSLCVFGTSDNAGAVAALS